MPMEDGFNPDYPLPLFLIGRDEPQDIQKACDRAVVWSRVSKASILIAAAMAACIAVLSVGEPATFLTAVRASLLGDPGLRSAADQRDSTIQSAAARANKQPTPAAQVESRSAAAAPAAIQLTPAAQVERRSAAAAPAAIQPTPAAQVESRSAAAAPAAIQPAAAAQVEIRSAVAAPAENQPTAATQVESGSAAAAPAAIRSTAADAQPLPPTTTAAPPRGEIAASVGAGRDQVEKSERSSDALFRQYQAWAAERDAPTDVKSAQPAQDDPQPAQDDPQPAQDDPEPAQDDAAKIAQTAPAQAAENASAPHQLVKKKHRHEATRAQKPSSAQAVRPLMPNLLAAQLQTPSAQAVRPPARRAQAHPSTQSARARSPQTAQQDAQANFRAAQQDAQASFRAMFGLNN